MLQLKYNNDTYEIHSHKDSNWREVRKNNEMIALVMDEQSSLQVVHRDINLDGYIKFLTISDFDEKNNV